MRFDRIVPVLLMGCLLTLPGHSICSWLASAGAAEKNEPTTDVQVKVVRAGQAWFAAELHVTGYLVARAEAVVFPDRGYRVSEILATEGDRVNSGQLLARLAREGPAPPAGPPGPPAAAQGPPAPATKDPKAPPPGAIIRSTAARGAVASAPSMRGEPVFHTESDNDIEGCAEGRGVDAPAYRWTGRASGNPKQL